MQRRQILVFAANRTMCDFWREKEGYGPMEAVFVSSARMIQGLALNMHPIVMMPGCSKNPMWSEIKQVMKASGVAIE